MSGKKDIEYLWKSNQKALGLTDEQVEEAKKDPERVRFIERSSELVRRKIVAEVNKVYPLDYPPIFDIQTGYDSDLFHLTTPKI